MREPGNLRIWLCAILVVAGTIPMLFALYLLSIASGYSGGGALFVGLGAYAIMLCTHLPSIAILWFAMARNRLRSPSYAKLVIMGAAGMLAVPVWGFVVL